MLSDSTPCHNWQTICRSVGIIQSSLLYKILSSSSSFRGLGLLVCSGSELIFLKLMNLLDNW